MERRVLGKGLGALIPERQAKEPEERQGEGIVYVEIDQIKASRVQPREEFSQEKLEELVASIKEKGVIQPVLVRAVPQGYELIAGERRLRAARALNITQLPAIIKDVTDSEALQLSLIENIQREDLNGIDEAQAYRHLIDEFGFSHDRIAQAVGKERSSVSNALRLLNLPAKVQALVKQGRISMGHARALLAIEDENEQLQLCEDIISSSWSVRQIEDVVKARTPGRKRPKRKIRDNKDPHLMAVEEELQHLFATKVRIIQEVKRGKIQIEYYSPTDLERILEILRK